MAEEKRQILHADPMEFETSEDVEIIPTFDGLGLREELLRGIYAYGDSFSIWCLTPV